MEPEWSGCVDRFAPHAMLPELEEFSPLGNGQQRVLWAYLAGEARGGGEYAGIDGSSIFT